MVHVELVDLPTTVRGFVTKSVDDYTIVINARMSQETRVKTYRHELEHIARGDLDGSGDIDQIERILHDVDRKDSNRQV